MPDVAGLGLSVLPLSHVVEQVETDILRSVERRAELFQDGGYARDVTHRAYDVSADGRGFVMVRRQEASHLTVTLNRFVNLPAGIRRRRN